MAERLPSRYTYASDLLFKIAKYTVGITGVLSVGYVAAESLDADSEADTTFVEKYSDDITGTGLAMATGATFLFWTGGVACRSDEMQWYKESNQAEAILQTLPKFETENMAQKLQDGIQECRYAVVDGTSTYEELQTAEMIVVVSDALQICNPQNTKNTHAQIQDFESDLTHAVNSPSFGRTTAQSQSQDLQVPTNVAHIGSFLDKYLSTHDGEDSWTSYLINRWQTTSSQNA